MPYSPKRQTRPTWIARVKHSGTEQQYHTQRWRNYRKRFLSVHPLCVRCKREATVVDHITPARFRPDLFWNTANHQSLCEFCHNRKRATED